MLDSLNPARVDYCEVKACVQCPDKLHFDGSNFGEISISQHSRDERNHDLNSQSRTEIFDAPVSDEGDPTAQDVRGLLGV